MDITGLGWRCNLLCVGESGVNGELDGFSKVEVRDTSWLPRLKRCKFCVPRKTLRIWEQFWNS